MDTGYEQLPDGWTVWSDEPDGRSVLAYRPDVFDSRAYPAPCLPTIYVSNGSRARRPGAGSVETATWHVTLFLEPDVEGPTETHGTREAAVDAAVALADRFEAGEVDYRSLYQVPREDYLDRLDELTGSGT
jgi:hypothetical protein